MHSCIYTGVVRHRRSGDIAHEFRYPLAWHFVDLSEAALLRQRGLLGAPGARWSMAALEPKDHQRHPPHVAGDGDAAIGSLAEAPPLQTIEELERRLRDRVEHACGKRPRGGVRMLTQLSCLGLYFSPLTLYYFYELPEQGRERLAAVVAEVNNTPWGEQHNYVLAEPETKVSQEPLSDANLHGEPLGHGRLCGSGSLAVADPNSLAPAAAAVGEFRAFEHEKDFHVSPFMTADRRYQWRWTTPGDTLAVHIESVPADGQHEGRQPRRAVSPRPTTDQEPATFSFDATMTLRRRAWTRGAHLRLLATRPLAPMRILGGIYWEALRLWWKGARFVPHPQRA